MMTAKPGWWRKKIWSSSMIKPPKVSRWVLVSLVPWRIQWLCFSGPSGSCLLRTSILPALALSRPLFQKTCWNSSSDGATTIAHGCTGMKRPFGLKSLLQLLDPNLKVVAPVREWKWSREEETNMPKKTASQFLLTWQSLLLSIKNLVTCKMNGVLKTLNQAPKKHLGTYIFSRRGAIDSPEFIDIEFSCGAYLLNGEKMKVADLIQKLNEIGGQTRSVWSYWPCGKRLVGTVKRFMAPRRAVIICLGDWRLDSFREKCSSISNLLSKWVSPTLIYNALWFSLPATQAFTAYIKETQKVEVNGTAKAAYKGTPR